MNITTNATTHISLFVTAAIFSTTAFIYDMSANGLANSNMGSDFQAFTSQFPQELLAWL